MILLFALAYFVWESRFEEKGSDSASQQPVVQTTEAGDVASALDSSLLGNTAPDLKGVATNNLTAYDSYLKGLEQQAIYSYGSLEIAEDQFKQALVGDPGFTDARLALVRNHLLMNSGTFHRPVICGCASAGR